MSWSEFLAYLVSPNGIAAAVGVVLSFVVEYVPGYEPLAGKWKRIIFGGVCFAVPLLAAVLGIFTASWSASWAETFWPVVQAAAIAFAGGTFAHVRKL